MTTMASQSIGQLSSAELMAFDKNDPKANIKAAQDFESFFVGQVFEEAYKAIPKSDLMDDNLGMDFYQTMFIQEAVKNAVKSGRGLGLTEMVTKKADLGGLSDESLKVSHDNRQFGVSSASGYVSPLGNTEVTSDYGLRVDPINNTEKNHEGVDLKAKVGTPIHASNDGKVVYSGYLKGYGQVLKIKHNDGLESLYAHNSSNIVEENTLVKRGQVIGYTGNSGRSTGPHLHFELSKNGESVDPGKLMNFVKKV